MATERIGFQCLDKNAQRDTSFYHRIVPQQKEWMFEADRNNQMLRYLGLAAYDNMVTTIWGLPSYLPTSEVSATIPKTPYYVVFPGSLLADKCWPPEKFASVIEGLKNTGCQPVLCGSTRESGTAKTIMALVPFPIVDLTGKTSLMDLSYIIQHSEFLLSNDSGAVHIAAAVGTLAFVILGGGHFGRFLPYPERQRIVTITNEAYRECFNCYWVCKYECFRCIQEVPTDQVLKTIRELLNEAPSSSQDLRRKRSL
jgi:ADP-heptose:LPS heptosyltransferase